jgi:hypothetical protein
MEELKKYDKEVATTAAKVFLTTNWKFESLGLEIVAQHTKNSRLGQHGFLPFKAPAHYPKRVWLQLVVSFSFEIPHG